MNQELLLATHNAHKVKEIREILSPHGIILYGLGDLNIHYPEPEETGSTYRENALIKCATAANFVHMPVIADDSGLEIIALDHGPGINSARFAESLGGHPAAIRKILADLEGKDRSARFVCDIVLMNVESEPLFFEGIVDGAIGEQPMGEGGFGYDPIFVPEGESVCFAILGEEKKNAISHRGRALSKLLDFLISKGMAR